MKKATVSNHRFDLRLSSLGFWVAFLSAGIGIGGGTILVSILHSALGFDFKKAARISLATIVPITFIGSISHFISYSGEFPLKYYVAFIPACILGALGGGKMLPRLQNRWLTLAFGAFLLLVGLRMLKLFDFPSLIYIGMDGAFFQQCLVIIPTGMALGFIGASLGVGCGLLIVPLFVIVIGFDIYQAITLSLTTMFFMTISTTFINNRQSLKAMELNPAKSLLIPALGGGILGAVISSHLPADVLKNIFGSFMLVMACYIIASEIAIWHIAAIWLDKFKKISAEDISA